VTKKGFITLTLGGANPSIGVLKIYNFLQNLQHSGFRVMKCLEISFLSEIRQIFDENFLSLEKMSRSVPQRLD
jgi:hypothetical protein